MSRFEDLYGHSPMEPELACRVVGIKPWWMRFWYWITRQ